MTRLAGMITVLRLRFSTILLFFSIIGFAQDVEKTIMGSILDKQDKTAISFASIYIKGQSIGTISNEEGRFVFHFPHTDNSTIIVVSSLGYESLEMNIDEFKTGEAIFLSSKVSQLDEVVITSTKKKKLTARQIVKKAYKTIAENYPVQPYILEGFIRDLQKEDDQYVEYLECAAKFYNQAHFIKEEPDVELVEIRINSIAQKNPWNEEWERKNSIMDLIEDDFIRFDYGPIRAKGGWQYEIEDVLPYDSRFVYKIRGVDAPFQETILYIDTKSFAFVRMELTRKKHNRRSWKRRLTNGEEISFYHVIFEYQQYQGKMYLKYQKEEDTWEIYDIEDTSKLLFVKNPKKELFINRIITEDLATYSFQENMTKGSSIENQSGEYNAKFWANYNAPLATKKLSEIEKYLKSTQN